MISKMKTYLPRKRAESRIIENIMELCRLCLNTCVNGVPIYPDSDNFDCDVQPLLATKIMMCAGIDVVPRNKELSNIICLHCIGEINNNYSFRKVCQIAHQKIKLHLHASQQIKYKHAPHQIKMLAKDLDKDLGSNLGSKSVNSTQNGKDDHLESYALNQEIIDPVHQLLDPDKLTSNNQSIQNIEATKTTYLDYHTKEPQIVEAKLNFESDNNIENLQIIENRITEPILESQQNNEFNQNNFNIENTSHINVNINHNGVNVSEENEVINIENNILVPNADMPDVSKNAMIAQYFEQVVLEPPHSYFMNNCDLSSIKADEKDVCSVIKCTENVNAASTSSFNNETLNIDINNQEYEESTVITPEEISQSILTRLTESGIVIMEGDGIAICDIGVMHLETSDGEIVTMEIAEEGSHDMNKTNGSKRKKKPATPEVHTCLECGTVVSSRHSLTRHALRHSGERLYSCDKCPRTFAQHATLRRHRTLHADVRPFPCPCCDASFTQRTALAAHARSHASDAPVTLHACNQCDATYAHASGLVRHIKRVHLGRRATCHRCSRTLSDASSLKRHLPTCTGKKILPCTDCSKKFTDERSLKEHQETCTGKTAQCPTCPKSYADRNSLLRHQQSCHKAQCTGCSQTFADKISLNKHLQICLEYIENMKLATLSNVAPSV